MDKGIYAGLNCVMYSYLDERINQKEYNGTFEEFQKEVFRVASNVCEDLAERIEGKFYVTEENFTTYERNETYFNTLVDACEYYNEAVIEYTTGCTDGHYSIALYDFVEDEILQDVEINPHLKKGDGPNPMTVKMSEPDTFYTGGGIWLCGMHVNRKLYYIYDGNGDEVLTFYSDGFEDGCEFPCREMVWSKPLEDLNDTEVNIYNSMKRHFERHAI